MILKDKNGREIECEWYGSQDDVQCSFAVYVDNDTDVDDDTIEWLCEEYAETISDALFQNAVARAEAYYEGNR